MRGLLADIPSSIPGGQQLLEYAQVDIPQGLDIGQENVFIQFVNGLIHRAELDQLFADSSDKPSIRCSASGGQFGRSSRNLLDGVTDDTH